jgi:hypothetical protein
MCRRFVAADADREPARTTEAVRRALPDLLRLNRYERRAAARRDRAIRSLTKSEYYVQGSTYTRNVRISQNEPNFCWWLEQLTASICEFRDSQREASSSSTRTVADQACDFERH